MAQIADLSLLEPGLLLEVVDDPLGGVAGAAGLADADVQALRLSVRATLPLAWVRPRLLLLQLLALPWPVDSHGPTAIPTHRTFDALAGPNAPC